MSLSLSLPLSLSLFLPLPLSLFLLLPLFLLLSLPLLLGTPRLQPWPSISRHKKGLQPLGYTGAAPHKFKS
ncbi:MAG: hypothetical protein ABT04_00650 [Granulicella sp. SCN 62-9]|nr:MAG: hypothetical protein ABT04_00650 [Granulicella sp. SCN 62-9]